MSPPRLQPVFEEGGEPEIFSIPRAYIERESTVFFQVPEPGGKLGIFQTLRAYMEGTVEKVKPRDSLRSVLHQQAIFKEG